MSERPNPTDRELEILKILWDQGEGTVRSVYEELRQHAPIVQNTVQAFLRTMEEKGLVRHRVEGRTFIYQPTIERQAASRQLAARLLHRVFDGSLDQLVESLLSSARPTAEELVRLEALIETARRQRRSTGKK